MSQNINKRGRTIVIFIATARKTNRIRDETGASCGLHRAIPTLQHNEMYISRKTKQGI